MENSNHARDVVKSLVHASRVLESFQSAGDALRLRIPFVAIDIPHPGATYFCANDCQAGLMGGHYLGRWAKRHWVGEADEVLLIELHRAGSLPRGDARDVSGYCGGNPVKRALSYDLH